MSTSFGEGPEEWALPSTEGDSIFSSLGSAVVDAPSVAASTTSMASAASSKVEGVASPSRSKDEPLASEETLPLSGGLVADSHDQDAPLIPSKKRQAKEKNKSKSFFSLRLSVAKIASKLGSTSSVERGEEEEEASRNEGNIDKEKSPLATPTVVKIDDVDDTATPLLPQDSAQFAEQAAAEGGVKSKFFCEVCTSRRALIVANLLALVTFVFGFVAAVSPGHISIDGQNVAVMVFNILFTIVILYAAFQWNRPIVLMGLLWEAFVLVFSCVGIPSAFTKVDWSDQPKGTEHGTEAFIIIALVVQLACIYAQVVFVYELTKGIAVPGGHGKLLCREDHPHAGKGEHV